MKMYGIKDDGPIGKGLFTDVEDAFLGLGLLFLLLYLRPTYKTTRYANPHLKARVKKTKYPYPCVSMT